MDRTAGILLSIPSLPSKYGIGDMGYEAREFINTLHKTHVHLWQLLPMNPMGYGHSPYQPYSSKAGEPLLISLDLLKDEGYIKEIEPASFNVNQIEYEKVASYKEPYYQEAYKTMLNNKEKRDAFEAFKKSQKWVIEYGIFYAFKKHHGLKSWLEWDKDYREYPKTKNGKLTMAHRDDIEYAIFLQFLFYTQWQNLRAYAHEHNIKILGDIPFYVGLDSLDVWVNQDEFLLDGEGNPTFIAGVPPDYFSPTGQRWGNPIYDWDKMKKDHYSFWIDRLAYVSTMFDIIRIDHFRAFDTYWKIPASCPTAVDGKWILGPSHDFFDTVKKELPDIQIVAEDLGDLREEVLTLRDDYNLPGMQVIQFHLDPDTDNKNISDVKNLVVYTGTHDNQTLFSWYLELPFKKRSDTFRWLTEQGYKEMTFDKKIIHFCLDAKADTVIFPVQDLLLYKDWARINTPGTVGDPNWMWRLDKFDNLKVVLEELTPLIIETKRG